MAKAFFAAGETAEFVFDMSSIPLVVLARLKKEADLQGPWRADRLGNLIELTYEEREQVRAWRIRPYDVDWSEVQLRRREQDKKRNRERMRQKRKAEREAKNMDCRESSIMTLIGSGWITASSLVHSVHGGQAWNNDLSSEPLSGASLRVLVHRTLDRLEKRRLILSRRRKMQGPGQYGLRIVCRR